MKQSMLNVNARAIRGLSVLGVAALLLSTPAVCVAGTFAIESAFVTLTGDQDVGFYAYTDPTNDLQVDWGVEEQVFSHGVQLYGTESYASPGPTIYGMWQGTYTPVWLVSWTPAAGESTPPTVSATLSVKLRVAGYESCQVYDSAPGDTCQLETSINLGAVNPADIVYMDFDGGSPLQQAVNLLDQEATPTLTVNGTAYANWTPLVGTMSAADYDLEGPLGGPGWFQYNGQWLIYLSTNQLQMTYNFYQTNTPPKKAGIGGGTMLSKVKGDGIMKIVSINGQAMDSVYPDDGLWP